MVGLFDGGPLTGIPCERVIFLLAAGCWLLAAGCWLLALLAAAGCPMKHFWIVPFQGFHD
jgi:hypothetical protein